MEHHFNQLAPKKSVVQTNDIDEQAHNLTQWQQVYDQVSNGSFYGCIEGLDYPDMHLFKEFTQRALRQQCNIAPNSIWLGIPCRSEQSKINGLQLDTHQLMCRSSDYDFELITPEQFTIYGVVLNQHSLYSMAEIQGLSLKNLSTRGAERIDCNPILLNQTRLMIEKLINHSELGLRTDLQQDMLSTLALNLLSQPASTQTVAPSYQHRLAIVEKVKAFIDDHPQQAVTITQLCELTFVSRRTLQYSFESILGINPLRFLRLTRLNNVRRELKQPDLHHPISVIAANWGFWHPGQFTKDYTQLFGENPSLTRQRYQPAQP
ncbi:helix-turn-helix domain-containing protein [Shewanella sp. SG44-6]|uniref:helix-turn-helix domain-containing protein n=1 Tax=Shewanella sp. SG44-6 TaxID=2760959 RepID=UPI0016007045|nr:helix-turn-helix domain-containing protein [Shewanella sp. SG44-6]MBB1390615.1 helix-turn-helix domain-containing protein [Shewanella sp. SG44-6]